MNQKHVDIVDVQPGQRLVDCLEGIIETVAVVPNLCGDIDLFTFETAGANGRANFLFVVVESGGVNAAITQI